MTYSTQYRSDRFGCVTLQIDPPDSKGLLKSVSRYVPVSWYNLVNINTMTSDGFYLYFDISGSLYRKGVVDFDSDYGRILIADDNFLEYFVLLTCRKDAETFLDYAADEVHIFTRQGDPNFVNLITVNDEIMAQMPDFELKYWELL